MKNGKDFWCFTVIGSPVTKKRARTMGAIHFTFDSWYDKMVGDAFQRAYPNFEPLGHEHYNTYERKGKLCYRMKKTSTKEMLPKVRIFILVYTNETNSGDDDNYVKTILDALNRKLYVDDCQVCVPTPRVITQKGEVERVEILAIRYNQDDDKGLQKLKAFNEKHAKVIDIYDEYEDVRLCEHTKNYLYNKLCKPKGCPKFETCNFRTKMEIIKCSYRDTITEDDVLVSLNCRKRSCLCKTCNNTDCDSKCVSCNDTKSLNRVEECDDYIE